MKLTDFANDVYSQFGEDGIIEHVFSKIGTTTKFCVEFGAGDDIQGSNTATLWQNGWKALLLEGDEARYKLLRAQVIVAVENCTLIHQSVFATGESIDLILASRASPSVDFMSIDIDGNDYHIWQEMDGKPRVLCVEFNPTIPPHISLYQKRDDGNRVGFGASLKALIELAPTKGYTFIGATHCNAFFVLDEDAGHFSEYERDPGVLFPLTGYTYLVTDYNGQAVGAGNRPPWMIYTPYIGCDIAGDETFPIMSSVPQIIAAYEDRYGPAIKWGIGKRWPNIADDNGPAPDLLLSLLRSDLSPICIVTTGVSAAAHLDWIKTFTTKYGYEFKYGGQVLALVKE